MTSKSEFADAYKLKPDVLNKRNARLQRRSTEWKNLRYEKFGERRNLENLSPLQEQDPNVANVSNVYEEKTPVKPTSDRKSKAELLKQRLIQWKQDKEKKKKLEAAERAKKQPFKVTGVKHKDTDLFTKNKQGLKPTATTATTTSIKPKNASNTSTRASTIISSTAKVSMSNHSKPTVNTSQKTVPAVKPTKPKPQPTTRITRHTRASAKLKSSPKVTKSASARTHRTAKVPEAPKPKITRGKKPSPEYNLDLARVSTLRGESFAPTDFTFEAPDNIKSFAFQPLSPASAASFLDPHRDLTSTSFFTHDPPAGRCSTPKSSREEGDNSTTQDTTIQNINGDQRRSPVKHSPPVRQTRSRSAHSSITSSDTEGDYNVTAIKLSTVGKKKVDKKKTESVFKEESTDSDTTEEKPRQSRRKSSKQDKSAHHQGTKQSEDASLPDNSSTDGESNRKASRSRAGRKKTAESTDENDMEVTEAEVKTPGKTRQAVCIQKGESAVKDSATEEKQEKTPLKEKSNTVTVKELEGKTPVKRRHSVRKQKGESDSDVDETITETERKKRSKRRQSLRKDGDSTLTQSLEEEKSVSNNERDYEGKTPVKMRRRSVRKQSNVSNAEVDKPDSQNNDETQSEAKTPVKRRQSVRNQKVMSEGLSDGGSDSDSVAKVLSPRSARRRSTRKSSRASVSEMCSEHVTMEVIQEEMTSTERVEDEVFQPSPETVSKKSAENQISDSRDHTKSSETRVSTNKSVVDAKSGKENCTPLRNRRCSSSDAHFLEPGLPMSAQRSGRKRRRTESAVTPSQAKSPEEWVKILSTSPMVEMRRRTPKAPRLADDSLSQSLNFDDVLEDPLAVVSAGDSEGIKTMETGTSSVEPSPAETNTGNTGTVDTAVDNKKKEERDVPYFRNLLLSETARLNVYSDEWNKISQETPDIPEEAEGQIRTTVGQAQLLIAQRFKQFSGLVDNCEFGTGEKETTCTDLQGFWDMIYFQVEDVDKKFAQLTTLRNNNWQEEKPAVKVVKKIVKKKTAVLPKPKMGGQSKFAAFRAQMKKQKEEAVAAESAVETVKVFDAGFFKVSSPVKSPVPHCEGGSPAKYKSNTATPLNPPSKDSEVAQVLFHKTPRRKSYVPSVPSPLLCDITPKPKPRRSLVPKVKDTTVSGSPQGVITPPSADYQPSTGVIPPSTNTTPKRRSIRLRKSLTLTPTEEHSAPVANGEGSGEGGILDPIFFKPSTSTMANNDHNTSPCDLAKFMEPTTPSQTSEENDSSFSKFFQASGVAQSAGRKSALKKLPSSQRRRSRRSVQFAASLDSSPAVHQRLPSTPFNSKDTLVPKPRVSHGDYLFTPPKEENEGDAFNGPGNSPVLRGMPRPSLLFTPANQETVSRTAADNLMVFTP